MSYFQIQKGRKTDQFVLTEPDTDNNNLMDPTRIIMDSYSASDWLVLLVVFLILDSNC